MKAIFRWAFLFSATVAGLFVVRQALACGPFLTTARFDDIGVPDTPMKDFAAGKLGILRPTLSKENLVIAYRYMEGWGLDEAARAEVLTPPKIENGGPSPEPDVWLKARAAVMGGEPTKIDPFTQLKKYNSYVRIQAGAFTHAAAKLEELSKTHGAKSPELTEWVKGQDQVFASIATSPVIPSVVKGPEWLRAERQYQIAAAFFYAEKFDDARKAFYAISLDKGSPWQAWGVYLQARCWVREATLKPLHGEPMDKTSLRPYQQAQGLLEGLLKSKYLPDDVQEAAQDYRDLVRHQTEPGRLRDEALVQLSAPKPGEEFRPALARLLSAEKHMKDEPEAAAPRLEDRANGLRAWLDAFRPQTSAEKPSSLLAGAKRSPAMLVAALDRAPAGDPDEKALMALAAKVPSTSPAYASLRWQLLWREMKSLDPSCSRAPKAVSSTRL